MSGLDYEDWLALKMYKDSQKQKDSSNLVATLDRRISEVERTFIVESNAIEGVYDEAQAKRALYAWRFLKKQKELTISVILRTHKLLMLDLLGPQKGYFRTQQVWIGGKEAGRWERVPFLMEAWVLSVKQSIDLDPTESAAKFYHVQFEHIHPFIDGNGRIGRMLMNWQRLQCGLPILVIKESERRQYYEWFRDE